MNVKLIIINENKRTEKIIVKNGVSKYGFIAKQITFSPFYLSALSNREFQSIQIFKSYIDEKRYKFFYVKVKKIINTSLQECDCLDGQLHSFFKI